MQFINFSLCPVHMRVPFAAGVSFVWSCVLSVLRGEMKPLQSDQKVAVQGQCCGEQHVEQ